MGKQTGIKAEGTITVFLSLILLITLSLIFTMIEGARISTAKVYAERAMSTAMDSVLAEYYGPLWKEYHVFALQSGDGSAIAGSSEISSKMEDYISYTLQPCKDDSLSNYGVDLFETSVKSITVTDQTMLTDYQGKLLMNEAVEYMKYRDSGKILELLLNKLTLLESPKKVSIVYEEKQKVEEELVEIDEGILELMELFDGLKTNKKGIETGRKGKLKTADFFIKQFYSSEPTMEGVGVNQENIFQALRNRYINPKEQLEVIKEYFSLLEEAERQLAMLKIQLESISLRISQAEHADSTEDSMEEKEQRVKYIRELESEKKEIKSSIKKYERVKEQSISSLTSLSEKLTTYIIKIEPLIEDAQTQIDKLIEKTKKADVIINDYEEVLVREKGDIEENIYSGLEEDLQMLHQYNSYCENGYKFDDMKSILTYDRNVLEDAKEVLMEGKSQLKQGNYKSAEGYLTNTCNLLCKYQISGLTLDYSTLVLSKDETLDPLESTKELMQSGITSLIIDPDTISEAKLLDKLLPSQIAALGEMDEDIFTKLMDFFEEASIGEKSRGSGSLFDGFGNESNVMKQLGDGLNTAATHLLYQDYLEDHFNAYPKKGEDVASRKPSVLSYEQEYLLIGKDSDKLNLSSVITRIIFIRTILDFVTILTDQAKINEAQIAAAALVGFTGLPILVSITKTIILLVWSFMEALLDTCALMLGKVVPILKKNIMLQFNELFIINRELLQTKATSMAASEEISLSYHDYLRIFLVMKNNKDLTYRAMDLMQENINLRYEDDFSILNCLYGYTAKAEFLIKPKFIVIPFIRKTLGTSDGEECLRFKTEVSYSY